MSARVSRKSPIPAAPQHVNTDSSSGDRLLMNDQEFKSQIPKQLHERQHFVAGIDRTGNARSGAPWSMMAT